MEWYEPLVAITNGGDAATEYAKMPKGGIEEVTKLVYKNNEALVVELPFNWIDFGTWESVANYMKDRGFYKTDSETLEIESNDNFIYKKDKKFIAMIGVNNLVVVDTGDALLIIKKEASGKVGQIVDALKAGNKTELL